MNLYSKHTSPEMTAALKAVPFVSALDNAAVWKTFVIYSRKKQKTMMVTHLLVNGGSPILLGSNGYVLYTNGRSLAHLVSLEEIHEDLFTEELLEYVPELIEVFQKHIEEFTIPKGALMNVRVPAAEAIRPGEPLVVKLKDGTVGEVAPTNFKNLIGVD